MGVLGGCCDILSSTPVLLVVPSFPTPHCRQFLTYAMLPTLCGPVLGYSSTRHAPPPPSPPAPCLTPLMPQDPAQSLQQPREPGTKPCPPVFSFKPALVRPSYRGGNPGSERSAQAPVTQLVSTLQAQKAQTGDFKLRFLFFPRSPDSWLSHALMNRRNTEAQVTLLSRPSRCWTFTSKPKRVLF